MSLFLGPIHHWLYKKIETGAQRCEAIESAFKTTFSDDADALIAAVDEKYAAFPAGLPLEDIIGDTPIHTFLQGLIKMVETREGAIVKAFVGSYGDKAREAAFKAALDFGSALGESLKGQVDEGSMESVFKALYDHQLDGMPCDQGAQPEVQGKDLLIRQSDCLHRENWQAVDAPLDVMCKITGAWIEGFVKGAAPGMSYRIEDSVVEGSSECRYYISRQ